MARLARVAAVNVAHHVTQRGNARQFILTGDNERVVYLKLLRRSCELYELSLLGYCLMSNHVHLIVAPQQSGSLALALKQTHGRYATYWNATHQSSGHVWLGLAPLPPGNRTARRKHRAPMQRSLLQESPLRNR